MGIKFQDHLLFIFLDSSLETHGLYFTIECYKYSKGIVWFQRTLLLKFTENILAISSSVL